MYSLTFLDSLVVIQKYHANSHTELNNYRYCLNPLQSLLTECVFDSQKIKRLTNYLKPAISANYEDEIYAIFAIKGYGYKKSFVLYKDSLLFVDISPTDIVSNILERHHNLELNIYKTTIQSFFERKISIVPIATMKYSLLPVGSNSNQQTIWINPGRVCDLTNNNFQTTVHFENHFKLRIDRTPNRIYKLMERGFLAHGILKRDYDHTPILTTMHLFNFLGVSSTDVTRKVLKDFLYLDIPQKPGDFHKIYKKNHQEYHRKIIFKELDIEE